MSCKIVVNRESGNCPRLDVDGLLKLLGCTGCCVEWTDSATEWSADGFDTVVVCGGDGTLHNALNKCRDKKIIYAPCGTLNEAAARLRPIRSVGEINGETFSYVAACGSFTEIGYTADSAAKQRRHKLAYVKQVVRSYKCHDIPAQIDVDGTSYDGRYTLLMVIKNNRCFGFEFNKCYDKKECLYLLAVRSRGKDSLLGRIKMFFPFFRIFFLGVKRPGVRHNWLLLPFERLELTLKQPQRFCVDGEERTLSGKITFRERPLAQPIDIVQPPLTRKLRCLPKLQ